MALPFSSKLCALWHHSCIFRLALEYSIQIRAKYGSDSVDVHAPRATTALEKVVALVELLNNEHECQVCS
jgi:hypothetical protein